MKLIAQSLSPFSAETLAQMQELSRAASTKMLAPHACQLVHGEVNAAWEQWASQQQIDWAWVPERSRLSDIKLLVTDMDSTIITIECIDEIADMLGIKPQVSAITESAMRGEYDFHESLRRRVSLLAGLPATALDQVYHERLRLTPGASHLLAELHQHGVFTYLISGGFTYFTEKLQQRLGFSRTLANQLEFVDGKLTGQVLGPIVDAETKRDQLLATAEELGLNLQSERHRIIAMGDGANDLKMLAEAGFGVAYHAKPIVQQQAQYRLNHVGLDGILYWFG